MALLGRWVEKAFRNATVRNGSIPATQSSYMVVCLDMNVDVDVDIVFAEYTLNDGLAHTGLENDPQARQFERLIQ